MLSRWMTRLRALLRGHSVESEFDEELRYHLERQIEQNLRCGMRPDEARRAALRELGNPLLLRDEARETWRWRRLDELAHDLRYAARGLRNNPGFTAVAVLSLGFGIGAATTLFSVIDALDFRPLPYHEPDRLVWLAEALPETDRICPRCPWGTSVVTATDWRAQTRSYEAFGLQADTGAYWQEGGVSDGTDIGRASAGFFDVLGVRLALGREFVPEDVAAGAEPVVILSHETWRRRFNGDPTVIGARFEYFDDPTLRIGHSSTVVGVLPEGFRFGRDFPFWIPLMDDSGRRFLPPTITAVARLKPGIEPAAAEAELRAVHAGLAAEYPDAYDGRDAAVRPLRERLVWHAGEGRGTLFSITTIVLFVAVLNVAGLFTARAAARHQEFTVRGALGASRGRLVRQLLAEGITLGLAGGALGFVMAAWGVRIANLSFDMDRYGFAAQIDPRVLAFGTALSVVVGILAALLPASGVGRADLYSVLRESVAAGGWGRRVATGYEGWTGRRGWTTSALIVSQIAAGLILLTAAGLLGSDYLKLRYLDIGYDPVNLYEAWIARPDEYRPQPELLRPEAERARTRIESIPGVASASLRYYSAVNPAVVRVEGRIEPPAPDEYIPVAAIDPDYFTTLGTPILAGRTFSNEDRAGAPPVAVVNRSAAFRFWPDRSALGRQVFVGDSDNEGEWVTVVGVVGDIEWGGMARRHYPRLYLPLSQGRIYHPYIQVHFRVAAGRPEVRSAVEAALREEQLARPIRAVTSHEETLGERFLAQRINAIALNAFAAFALLLAAMGIYGSVAYAVARRTREVGVRVALGADRASILALFARHAVAIAVVGVALGFGGSFAITRVMQSFVSATRVTDPWVFGGAALLMASAVLIATYLPARRATAVDPTIALRGE